MSKIEQNYSLVYQELPQTPYTVVGGALGWINTDVSAVIPADAAAVAIVAAPAAAQDVGARYPGSAVTPNFGVLQQCLLICGIDASQSIDLYRAVANNVYTITGFFYR